MATTHTCLYGGHLVGTDAWLPPVESAHYRWSERYPHPGCSHLRCERCGSTVVSWAGLDLVGAVDCKRLVAHGPSEGLALHVIEPAPARLYACACVAYAERGQRALAPEEGPDHPIKALPWRCAGHLPLVVPGTLDGEAVNADVADLVVRALSGTAPAQRPWPTAPYEAELPAAWLAHLYALVPAGQTRVAIGEAVQAQLVCPDPVVLAAALDFYLFHPQAPGAERVAELLRDAPERLAERLPWSKKRDLASLAWKVLIERLAGPGDALALELARAHVLLPGALAGVLLRVGALDATWLAAHVVAVARATGLVPTIVDAMRHWEAALAHDALQTLRDALGPEVLVVARERLRHRQANAILEGL